MKRKNTLGKKRRIRGGFFSGLTQWEASYIRWAFMGGKQRKALRKAQRKSQRKTR